MEQLTILKLRLGKGANDETQDDLLTALLNSAFSIIMSKRYPFGNAPKDLEAQYMDLQIRIAMDLFNKIGAEGETAHSEQGISRSYQSAWVSQDLLGEIVPYCGVY